MELSNVEQAKYFKLRSSCQAFYNAARILWDNYNKDSMEMIIPCVVNTSFCSELSLKALLVESGTKFDYSHKLYELFMMLPQKIQDDVFEMFKYSRYKNLSREEILTEIKIVSDYFYKIRYISDFTIIINITFAKELMETLFVIEQDLCDTVFIVEGGVLSKGEEMVRDKVDKVTIERMIKDADKSWEQRKNKSKI